MEQASKNTTTRKIKFHRFIMIDVSVKISTDFETIHVDLYVTNMSLVFWPRLILMSCHTVQSIEYGGFHTQLELIKYLPRRKVKKAATCSSPLQQNTSK